MTELERLDYQIMDTKARLEILEKARQDLLNYVAPKTDEEYLSEYEHVVGIAKQLITDGKSHVEATKIPEGVKMHLAAFETQMRGARDGSHQINSAIEMVITFLKNDLPKRLRPNNIAQAVLQDLDLAPEVVNQFWRNRFDARKPVV